MRNILIIFFMFGILSCGRTQKNKEYTKVEDTYTPAYTALQLSEKFEIALKENKANAFDQIFTDWNKSIKPNSEAYINQNDTIKAIFTIFKELYKPFDLSKLGNWQWGDKLNSNCKYVAVQGLICYAILPSGSLEDADMEKIEQDSIKNFRPPINLSENKVVYLTEEYSEALSNFLGTESTEVGEGGIMRPSQATGESLERFELLRPYIPILQGHWGGYWHIETHPYISMILFNSNMTKARIAFRVGYQGGDIIMKKSGKKWKIGETLSTWIE